LAFLSSELDVEAEGGIALGFEIVYADRYKPFAETEEAPGVLSGM
tara:strand:+ start:1009 stop:1143 length:135 start_codon:yes stop_codon:yes gene_type:complete